MTAQGRTRKLRGSSRKVRLRGAEGTVHVQTAITGFQQRIHCQRGKQMSDFSTNEKDHSACPGTRFSLATMTCCQHGHHLRRHLKRGLQEAQELWRGVGAKAAGFIHRLAGPEMAGSRYDDRAHEEARLL